MAEKEKSPKKDVDTLLTEVASAAGVPKKPAKKIEKTEKTEVPSGAPKTTAAAPAASAKAAAPVAEKKMIRIRQIRSGICTPVDQKQALKGLGLRRIRHEVVRADTPATRGQILKIRHLVEVVGE
ncbi:MAG TPA: 50S ribosomal protein L30 [Thermoanaerobaculia bacterium]|nr:50S ribosomal protein L30 [Thermoanaerobaculia bacterium]